MSVSSVNLIHEKSKIEDSMYLFLVGSNFLRNSNYSASSVAVISEEGMYSVSKGKGEKQIRKLWNNINQERKVEEMMMR